MCPRVWGQSKCSEVSCIGLEPQAQVGSASALTPAPSLGGLQAGSSLRLMLSMGPGLLC